MALLLLPIPCAVNPAGLGKLAVLSSLGQPLKAEIDLLSSPAELAALSPRIASPADYERAGLPYNPALSGALVNVQRQPNGQAYLELSSRGRVNEPFIYLLVELTAGRTHLARSYAALIDPAGLGPVPVAPARMTISAAQPPSESKVAVVRSTAARLDRKAAAHQSRDAAPKSAAVQRADVAADPGMTPGLDSRMRSLEEQSAARERALARLVERIAQLEKSAQAMQRMLDARKPGMAAAPAAAATASPPPKPAAEKPPAPKSAAVKPPASKPAAAASPATKPAVASATAPKSVAVEPPASKPAAEKPPAPKPAVSSPSTVAAAAPETKAANPTGDGTRTAPPAKQPVAPKEPEPGKPESKIAPTPSPKSSLVDTLFGSPILLVLVGSVILLGGFAYYWMNRRRPEAVKQETKEATKEITSEDMLNKLLIRDPSRDDVVIKLLEFYAARKDMPAFHSSAGQFRMLTGGKGEAWLKVAAMGYAMDPGNPLYEAGKPAPSSEPTTVIAL